MNVSIKNILRFKIMAVDGMCGTVHDLYFDDQSWTVRYIVASLSRWFPWAKVLIKPKQHIKEIQQKMVFVNMERERIRSCPDYDVDRPVFRQNQRTLHPFFFVGTTGITADFFLGSGFENPGRGNGNPHLRSAREIVGYRAVGPWGPLGYIADFLGTPDLHRIQAVELTAREGLRRKRQTIQTSRIRQIRWNDRTVFVT